MIAATPRALLTAAYDAFNTRDLERVLAAMHPEVEWPNGMDGGYVHGHDGVRDYWTRQWRLIDPHVEPRRFSVDEPRVDQEEPRASRGLRPRARRGDGRDQQGPEGRGQGRVRFPQEPGPADGGAAHDQAHLRHGARGREHRHAQARRIAAQAHEADRLPHLRLRGALAQGAAEEVNYQP
ncbi:MAG TPA: nuclear transport factor 2 family protein [Candidatus Methylomirabilis sp.]|nr:nuclear transport factor 2 family protein [Candidatus Methylomirabilis sp.]